MNPGDPVASWMAAYDASAVADRAPPPAAAEAAAQIADAGAETTASWLEQLVRRPPPSGPGQARLLEQTLRAWAERRLAEAAAGDPRPLAPALAERIAQAYRHWGPQTPARGHLLRGLAAARSPAALRTWAELIASDPPTDPRVVGLAFAPLLQSRRYDPSPLFPRLLDAVQHISVAAAAIDLANFVVREGLLPRHPARERADRLAALLGELAQRLGRLEQQLRSPDAAPETSPERVADSVALAVSLCDALALCQARAAVGKLYQALEVGHRRLRVEAAAALARLGEPAAADVLAGLAAEPSARLRVLAYADELGLLDRIDPKWRTPAAEAEAELALWLAQPGQLGLPPTELELLDHRRQRWPGRREPVDCYLFRFTYRAGKATYTNVGLAGPVCCALRTDVNELPPDELYALFAGRQVEDERVAASAPSEWGQAERAAAAALARRIQAAGAEDVQPALLGRCLDRQALVAEARWRGRRGLVVADDQRVRWRPRRSGPRAIGPQEAWWIYAGKTLLDALNPAS